MVELTLKGSSIEVGINAEQHQKSAPVYRVERGLKLLLELFKMSIQVAFHPVPLLAIAYDKPLDSCPMTRTMFG